jgi:hypothetical protein
VLASLPQHLVKYVLCCSSVNLVKKWSNDEEPDLILYDMRHTMRFNAESETQLDYCVHVFMSFVVSQFICCNSMITVLW